MSIRRRHPSEQRRRVGLVQYSKICTWFVDNWGRSNLKLDLRVKKIRATVQYITAGRYSYVGVIYSAAPVLWFPIDLQCNSKGQLKAISTIRTELSKNSLSAYITLGKNTEEHRGRIEILLLQIHFTLAEIYWFYGRLWGFFSSSFSSALCKDIPFHSLQFTVPEIRVWAQSGAQQAFPMNIRERWEVHVAATRPWSLHMVYS